MIGSPKERWEGSVGRDRTQPRREEKKLARWGLLKWCARSVKAGWGMNERRVQKLLSGILGCLT